MDKGETNIYRSFIIIFFFFIHLRYCFCKRILQFYSRSLDRTRSVPYNTPVNRIRAKLFDILCQRTSSGKSNRQSKILINKNRFEYISMAIFTFESQHCPVAQVAFSYRIHVVGSQHGLSHVFFGPQSHCSPSSTTLLPQTGSSNDLERRIGSESKYTVKLLLRKIITINRPALTQPFRKPGAK